MKLWSVILVAMLSVVHLDADARRMGGGKSIGKQSSNVTQREAAPPAAPAAPMQQNAANSAAPKPAAAPNAAAGAPKKPWGAMLGGLAAGLGLAWLANSLGLGAAFGNFLLIALLALVVMVVIGMVMRARKPAASQTASSPFAFQGAGAPAPVDVQMPRQYNPEKVGNDASARPWERAGTAFQAQPAAAGGQQCGPQRGGFGGRRHLYRAAQQIGLHLHQQRVRGAAAIHPQRAQRRAGIGFHRPHHVQRLQRDRLQRGAGDVGAGGAAGQPVQRAARLGRPVRRAQPCQRGDDIHPAIVHH